MRSFVGFAAFGAALLPCVAFGQAAPGSAPDSPQDIVVTATRVPSAVGGIPAGVTVIDRATIEQRGYMTLVDVLSAVPGLHVAQSGGPGSQASVFVRGTNSNHVLVLIDGVPVNDPADPGGAYNFGVDTLADVERIEVVRGPMSSLYGSGAIGGVINVITRHGRGALHGHVVLAAGSPRAGLAQADVAGGGGIWDFAANAQGLSARGFDQTPQREIPAYTGEADGDRTKSAQIELGVTPMADTRFSLLLRARDAKYGYDEVGSVAVDAGNASGYDSSLFGKIALASKLFDGVWTTDAFLTRLQNDRRYTIALSPHDPDADTGDSRYHGRRTDGQWNNAIHLPDWNFVTSSSLTFGYEHVADDANTKVNTNSVYGPYLTSVHAHADSDAGYFGAQTTILARFSAMGQVREDSTTLAGDAFTWRVGGVLNVPEILSHLKASYGTGFRAPALYDRYGIDSYGFVGNPHLQPEHSRGYEVGITTDVPIGPGSDTASVTVTYFNNRIRDLIETVYAANFLSSTPVNVDRARAEGVESAITWRVGTWMQADFGYTYTDSRDLSTQALLLRRPYNQGFGDMRLTPFPGFVVAPEILYIGNFEDYLTDNAGVPEPYVGRSQSGLIFNLNISWQVTPAVQVFAWGKNLGDSTFEPVNGYQTPGASVMVGTRLAY